MQLFKVTRNGSALNIDKKGVIKDGLEDDSVYLIVDDSSKTIWLYRGLNAPIVEQFIGFKVQKQMRMQLKGFYAVRDLNLLPDDNETKLNVLNARIGNSKAEEIIVKDDEDKKEIEDEGLTEKQKQIKKMIDESRARETCVHKGLIAKNSIPELLALPKVPGYYRHMSIINASAYTETEIVEKFITEQKSRKTLMKLGELPNGLFFLEDVSSRILIKRGKVLGLDIMMEDNKFLGLNRIMAPIFFKERIRKPGNMETLLNSFEEPPPITEPSEEGNEANN
ncbi:MAG: hypothetical protein ACTSU2_11485 [Promethearchaeota archaeon]